MHFVNMREQTAGHLSGRLTRQLDAWPAVRAGQAECGLGTGFSTAHRAGTQIVHLHGGDEAQVYLTRPVIARLGDALLESGRVMVSEGGDWVRVRLDTESDVALTMSLASVAIQADAGESREEGISPCQPLPPRVPMRARMPRRTNGGLRERRHDS
jgi:Family of unknown function (DUF5519)